MKNRMAGILGILLAFTAAVTNAQDPTKVAPESYKLQLDNAIVRVLRVHYAAHSKVPVHDHSRWPAGYIYLNDADPITFRHTGWQDPVLTRRAVKAKSFRLSPTTAANETHMVENPNDTDSDFLRIEFKTLLQGSGLPHARYSPEVYSADKNFSKLHFENDKIRITRYAVAQRGNISVKTDGGPVLFIALSAANIQSDQRKSVNFQPGSTLWFDDGTAEKFDNPADSPFEFLRIDFKTALPRTKTTGR